VEGNAVRPSSEQINLKKFVVGNGVNEYMGLSSVIFAYTHGLISTEQYRGIREGCPQFQEYQKSPMFMDLDLKSACGEALVSVYTTMMVNQINMYNVYGNCAGKTSDEVQDLVKELLGSPNKFPHPLGNPMAMCLDSSSMESYFNLPEVRVAMHTNLDIDRWNADALTTTSTKMLADFLGISPDKINPNKLLDYSGTIQQQVTPIWRFLLDHGVQGVIYHGDVDMVCDFIGGMWAVEGMRLPRQGERQAWKFGAEDGSEQTGGFFEAFEGLTYVTVKGAGHLVPMWKPVEASVMLDRFVLNL
jgi:serine carboxypeptidase-like clade 2